MTMLPQVPTRSRILDKDGLVSHAWNIWLRDLWERSGSYLGQASKVTPLMNGTASLGDEALFSDGKHVHPTDTSRAADSSVVHNTGNESVAGNKTFTGSTIFSGSVSISGLSGINTGDETIGANSGLTLASHVLNLGTPSTITSATTNAVSGATHSHAFTMPNLNPYNGFVSLPTISDSGDGSVVIGGDGVANFYNANNIDAQVVRTACTVGTTLAMTDLVSNVIYAKFNNGNPTYHSTTTLTDVFNNFDYSAAFRVVREGAVCHIMNYNEWGFGLAPKSYFKDVILRGFERQSGMELSTSGTRKSSVTGGYVWLGVDLSLLDTNTAGSAGTLQKYIKTSGVWSKTTVTEYDSTTYSDGSDEQSLLSSKWVAKYFFRDCSCGCNIVNYYSGDTHTSASAAYNEQLPSPPIIISQTCLYVGKIVIKQGETTGIAYTRDWSGPISVSSTVTTVDLADHAALQTGVHGLNITSGKTLSATGNLTLSGTDGSTLNIGSGGALGTAAYVADNTLLHTTGNETKASGTLALNDSLTITKISTSATSVSIANTISSISNPSSESDANQSAYGISSNAATDANTLFNVTLLVGNRGTATHSAPAVTVTSLIGQYGLARALAGCGPVTSMRGLYGVIQHASGSTVTNAYGCEIPSFSKSGAGGYTNAYGLLIGNVTAGTSINRAIKTGTGAVELGGAVTITDSTASTTYLNGSLINAGGFGNAGAVNFNSTLAVVGATTLSGASTHTGLATFNGDMQLNNAEYFGSSAINDNVLSAAASNASIALGTAVNDIDGVAGLTIDFDYYRTEVTAANRFLILKYKDASNSFQVYLSTSNYLVIAINNAGSSSANTNIATLVPVNVISHICVNYDGTQATDALRLRVFINNVQAPLTFVGSAIPSTTPTMAATATTLFGSGSNSALGWMRRFRVYASSLSAANMLSLYQGSTVAGAIHEYKLNEGTGTAATDTGSNPINGTISNCVWSNTGMVGLGNIYPTSLLSFAPATTKEFGTSWANEIFQYRSATKTLQNIGVYQFGDGTNNTVIEADGTLRFDGTATVFDDIYIPVSTGRVPGANYPTWTSFTANTSAYTFAVNDYIDLPAVEITHAWKEGSSIEFHVHWATNGNNDTTARGVKWAIYEAHANMEAAGGTIVFAETTQTQATDTVIAANEVSLTNKYSTVSTVTMTGFKIGTTVALRLKRITATGTAPASNPFVTMVGIHYEKDTVGSRTASAK